MCLAGLSIEDAEDIYLFGTMITGFLLIGAGLALAYRRIKRAEPAVQTPTRLPAGIGTTGATSQKGLTEGSMVKSLEALTTAVNAQNNTFERMYVGLHQERINSEQHLWAELDYTSDQLAAVVRSQNLLCEQKE